jgi:hypothetical protein
VNTNLDLSPEEERALRDRTKVAQTVDTRTAALLINRKPQTLRRWACEGSGPVQPRRVNGRLDWVVSELRALTARETEAA